MGPTAPPSLRLESCLEGNTVARLVSARLGMRLESTSLFLCNKLGTAKQLCRTALGSPDKAKTPGQGESTAQRFSQTTLRKPTQHAAEKPTLSGYSAKRAWEGICTVTVLQLDIQEYIPDSITFHNPTLDLHTQCLTTV